MDSRDTNDHGGYLRLSIAERREAVAELSAEGLPTRKIGAILGVSHQSVLRDAGPGGPSEVETPSEPDLSLGPNGPPSEPALSNDEAVRILDQVDPEGADNVRIATLLLEWASVSKRLVPTITANCGSHSDDGAVIECTPALTV